MKNINTPLWLQLQIESVRDRPRNLLQPTPHLDISLPPLPCIPTPSNGPTPSLLPANQAPPELSNSSKEPSVGLAWPPTLNKLSMPVWCEPKPKLKRFKLS